MPDRYKDEITVLSTPYGPVEVGHRMVRKNHKSNILCLLCIESGVAYGAKTMKEFIAHILSEHPRAAYFARLRNHRKQMIV